MNVAAVILAAGGSSRMGRPKQLLSYRGRSLVRHAVEVARDGGCDPVVVVTGAHAAAVEAELAGVPTVRNDDWRQGPGASIRAGVAVVGEADAAVFLLCDQPCVDGVYVRRLIDEYRASGRPMVASAYADTFGVPALFDRTRFAALAALDPAAGAKQLLARDRDQVATVPFPAGAIDLDTPADYADLSGGDP